MFPRSLNILILWPHPHLCPHCQALKPVHLHLCSGKTVKFSLGQIPVGNPPGTSRGPSQCQRQKATLSALVMMQCQEPLARVHQGSFCSHLSFTENNEVPIYPGALQLTTELEMMLTYPKKVELKHLREKTIVWRGKWFFAIHWSPQHRGWIESLSEGLVLAHAKSQA